MRQACVSIKKESTVADVVAGPKASDLAKKVLLDSMSIQETIDYFRGRLIGLEAMLALTIQRLDEADSLLLEEKFSELRNSAARISLEAEFLDKATPSTEPFYRGLAESIDGVARYFDRNAEEY